MPNIKAIREIKLNPKELKELFYVDKQGQLRNKVWRGPKALKDSLAGYLKKGQLQIAIGSKDYQGSRIAYLIHHGEIPKGKVIMRKDGDPRNNSKANLFAD